MKPAMANIYLVEDDENIRELIRYALSSAGFSITVFEKAGGVLEQAQKNAPDLFLLDIMLPGMNGYELLEKIRENSRLKYIPAIYITAKGTEIDKVHGFDLGADDYIVKPFGVLELIARVKAVLRRGTGPLKEELEQYEYKDLLLNTGSREVYKNGEKIDLTLKEYELLLCFLENKGHVLSRDQLLEKIWGYDYTGETRTVDMHIKTLRQKLKDSTDNPMYISTVRGIGYKIENV
jgi:two-component system alkaline phosphatase synthesis response regulator PhoP